MRYVNLDTAPLWECVVLAVLSIAFMVWRCWRLFAPAARARSGAVMAAGMTAITCSALVRRDGFGHGVGLLVVATVSFGIASLGKLDALQVGAQQERDRERGIGSADVEAERAGAVVFARLVGVALVLWLGYWLLVTHVH